MVTEVKRREEEKTLTPRPASPMASPWEEMDRMFNEFGRQGWLHPFSWGWPKEMEAMGRLSSFIIHDLKNMTSMLSLVAQNAEEHMDNPDFQKDAINTISNTSQRINTIIGKR